MAEMLVRLAAVVGVVVIGFAAGVLIRELWHVLDE